MAKEQDTKVGKNIHAVEEALSKTEHFIEKNQKIILYIVGALVVLIGGYMAFKKFYLGPKETEAQSQMFWAEKYFEKDSLNLALNGDGNYLGFLDIIDEYGMTKSADLAHYYAGMCYLKKGQFEEAIDHLKDFDSDDQIVSSMAKGALGDAYMELGDNDKALDYYMKAADNNNNLFTTPMFLMKAGWTYEIMGNYAEALKLYERIQKDYYKSYESREIEKYIARAKGMLNQK
ncbi:MAG: tetratricopeptide repeat protein [Bacteroidales bacterium]